MNSVIKTFFQMSLLLLIFIHSSFAAKSFIYCSEGSPSAFNPQITTDGTSNNASAHTIYNRLVEFKYGSTDLTPALATSWTTSKDNKTFTFKLRKGVKFHKTKYFKPSRDFNADDVLFSFNRQRLKSHPYHKVNGGLYEYWQYMEMSKLVKDIKKVNDYEVSITLNRPEAPFLSNMAMSFMSILSKEYGDKLIEKNKKESIDRFPIGTGPFKFRKYSKDSLIRYRAHKNFYLGKPKLDNLIFSITKDSSTRYQKLKTGECHLINEPAPSDLTSIEKNKGLKVLKGAGFNVGYLAMNVKKGPFKNVLVRKAINMALNKNSYIKAIYMGNAILAKNPLPPSLWSYNDKIKPYNHNIKKAKELLTKAGYPNGFETEIWTLPVARPYNPNGKKMGEMMQQDLIKVGIKAKLITYDWPTYLSKSRKGEHQMIQMGWTGDNGDPDNFLGVLLGCASIKSGGNLANWCNKKFNDTILKAKRILDPKKRELLYKKAQRIFSQEVPWVPIAHSVVFRAMNKKVQGYKIDPLGGDIFREIDLL
ncbi:ABC transporter substrate-binding protein [Bacteriovoracales bacterium]|nr:ABC transporter substrate-binding protein [Bacteriovoracales bacterium]